MAVVAACAEPTPTPTPTPTPVPTAEIGKSVAVHYHGTLDDGAVFDSSRERDPLEFVVGSGQLIEGFDKAVRGMKVGDTVTVRLEPSEAYGEYDPELVLVVPAEQAPEGLAPGQQVQLANGLVVTVKEVTAESITLDANPPLAGEALTFEIELVEIY